MGAVGRCKAFLSEEARLLTFCQTHVTPPLKRKGPADINKIYDKRGQEMGFYPDVPEILIYLHKYACTNFISWTAGDARDLSQIQNPLRRRFTNLRTQSVGPNLHLIGDYRRGDV